MNYYFVLLPSLPCSAFELICELVAVFALIINIVAVNSKTGVEEWVGTVGRLPHTTKKCSQLMDEPTDVLKQI